MKDNNGENKIEPTLQQEKVDTNVQQQTIETKKQEPPAQDNKKSEEAQEDPNWRAFREARKKDRAEREAAERRASEKEAEATALKAAMEAAFAKEGNFSRQQQHYPESGNYQAEESEDERIEKKVQAALAARDASAERDRIERERQEYPQRLNVSYPDFHHTITQDNLDYLDYHFPEISRPLQRLPDGFDKWSDIYRAIKRFIPNNTNAKREAAKADANFNKPKSISSPTIMQPGESTSSARITEEKRASNWERMQRIMKGVS